jgi:hypothetical protein
MVGIRRSYVLCIRDGCNRRRMRNFSVCIDCWRELEAERTGVRQTCEADGCYRLVSDLRSLCSQHFDAQLREERRQARELEAQRIAAAGPPPSLFDTPPPARASDPSTSHAAAARLNRTQLNDHHHAVLAWLRAHGPATDDQMAAAMVADGTATRHEQARRWVRTLRENDLLQAATDELGQQLELENDSGRHALAWRAA